MAQALLRFLIFFTALLLITRLCFAADSAWNGFTTRDASNPSSFTPLYVPPGAKACDDASSELNYSGKWKSISAQQYYSHTLHSSAGSGASLSFIFTGTGIEWYGTKSKVNGLANVFLDDKLHQSVDTSSSKTMVQQLLFFSYGLSAGKHTLKIVSASSKPVDVDAFVVVVGSAAVPKPTVPSHQSIKLSGDKASQSGNSQWTLIQEGSTGVAAMQLAVISDSHAFIIDKVEHNPLTIDGHPAWGALYNLQTHALKPLNVQSNSFCAGGTFLSNGTLINVGGNPVVTDHTSAADFGDLDGLQAVRLFHPCDSADSVANCDIYENHARIHMASPRWYNTVLRIHDGSAMIIGGSKKGGWINNATTNNPTIEYYPPKSIHESKGMPIHIPFLVDTLNANLFPIAFSLPDGRIFMAANRDAMIYDWEKNSEQRLPQLPGGVRVTYPMSGTGLLLPLSYHNGYEPEILICGGSTIDDKKAGYDISAQDEASSQCARMVLTSAGISRGWQVEQMPDPRIMPDAVLLPTGDIVLINGGKSGIAGYGNVRQKVGQSNADNPVGQSVLYKPSSPVGKRFFDTGENVKSEIARLYHSVASLTPSGAVMVAGSNPNLDRSEERYGTEYRVEWLRPPYMVKEDSRPRVVSVAGGASTGWPSMIGFGEGVTIGVDGYARVSQFRQWIHAAGGLSKRSNDDAQDSDVGAGEDIIKVACMDLGYVTHAVHANSRLVYLETTVLSASSPDVSSTSLSSEDANKVIKASLTLRVKGPPDGKVYPPGPAWLYVVVDGVPSVGKKVMIGDGKGPVIDDVALENVLLTDSDQYDDGDCEAADDYE